MRHFLFTSESVAVGHPDKVCDQISDAILDACLAQDPFARVACETLVSSGLVMLAGEISTTAHFSYEEIVRQTIREIGYHDPELGFDFRSCGVALTIHEQSPDIAQGIDESNQYHEQGAGDQGIMFGYASDETLELMPLPILLAHRLVLGLRQKRMTKEIPFLRPDGKSQVTIEYAEDHRPVRIHTVVLSAQHDEGITQQKIEEELKKFVHETLPKDLIDQNTLFYINPTGRFVIGGPSADTGLTGRKTIVDTYGGMGRHGGGAFSGKDPTKVDRSGSYAMRYVAKNIVAAKLARRCELQVSYSIGVPHPISIKVDTFGTATIDEDILSRAIPLVFDLSPKGIIQMLNLRRPIYKKTAFGGHFGRNDPDFTWEKTDKVQLLLNAVKQISFS